MTNRHVETWSIEDLHKLRSNISFPEYQRQAHLWTTERKSRLIDTILRDIDIPKLYFNKTGDDTFEVIDGQQRLWTIWGFLDGEFPYAADGKERTFADLNPGEQRAIKKYSLQVSVFEGVDEEYLRELFLRLNLGLLLNPGEKLHAMTGAMKDFIFGKFVAHAFIQGLGGPARRYSKETLCAQIAINSFTRKKIGSFARTRYEDLAVFFREFEDPKGKQRELFRERQGEIGSVLEQLADCFGEKAGDLRNRAYVLSVFLYFEDPLSQGGRVSREDAKRYPEFISLLWERLKEEMGAGIDRKNRELYEFENYISSAPGERYQIERRHQKLDEYYGHYKRARKIKGD